MGGFFLKKNYSTDMSKKPTTYSEFEQIRDSLLKKAIKYFRDNSDLNDEMLLQDLIKETRQQFDKLEGLYKGSTSDSGVTKKRLKRKDRLLRKEHVGRYFLRLMEHELREAGIHQSLIPVFANSIHYLAGEENIGLWTDKINRLMEFGEKKGADYETILDSKPGKMISREIMSTYKKEIEKSPSFAKKMKNNLDEALVKAINPDVDGDVDIEAAVEKAYSEFIKRLDS
ncbi:MAG: hypothetical protein COV66_09515 [Nitrospinae bacterium CG11_big_fil_rev_8_21_14_0_20_45_15]|nr:MAG: hypothetical protein COV66_09515 [Nitrospinae bacterium CG11_big_fil_rev_8_21_14_0_20_45_15]